MEGINEAVETCVKKSMGMDEMMRYSACCWAHGVAFVYIWRNVAQEDIMSGWVQERAW